MASSARLHILANYQLLVNGALNGISMMQAVIFDMDGTLIDSEPMWKEAEKQVFSSIGVEVTDKFSSQTVSMTTRQVAGFWYSPFSWSGKSLDQV